MPASIGHTCKKQPKMLNNFQNNCIVNEAGIDPMKKRGLILLLLALLPLAWAQFYTEGNAYFNNVWGVEDGDFATYELKREMYDAEGHLIGVLDSFLIQYNVLNKTDEVVVGLNSTTVYVSFNDFSTQPFTFTHMPIHDVNWFLTGAVNNLVFNELQDIDLLNQIMAPIPLITSSFLLLPLNHTIGGFPFYETHGIDWPTALSDINSSINYYTAYNLTTQVLIQYIHEDVWNAELSSYFNETGIILWDLTTGWLELIEFNRTYADPLGFSILTSVKPYVPKSPGILGDMRVVDLFAWIGLGIGLAGLGIAFIAYKKTKR